MTTTGTFPTQDLLPKTETNALSFLEKYPEYDGRNVTIGILDTGVDPGAIGLSTLPDGVGRKLVHVADCTGCGDVKMDTEVMATKKDEKKGCWVIEKDLFGNQLVLRGDLNLRPFPTAKKDTSKEDDDKEEGDDKSSSSSSMPVRLALKRAYDLFPKKLTNRVQKYYKDQFEKENHRLAAPLQNELSEWKSQHGDGKPTKRQILEKDDIEARLNALNGTLFTSPADPLKDDLGPIFQIILFYDGSDYRVIVVDARQCKERSGDFSSLPMDGVLTDYRKEFRYATFSNVDMMNYAVNVYDDGRIVSIVVDAGAHGSHVAGIAARYHHPSSRGGDDDDEANGVAPGAKIVALKVGDSRLGSMETGTAMTRAMIEAVTHKCDVINLSYGEGCVLPNTGRFVALAETLVYEHGVVFVSSAGNNGPALSTVGAPGGTTEAILGVAAYVSPSMMKAEYSMEPNLKDESNVGTTYTWSSVGPTADGARGVDVTAPGAAITCVPNWCLQRNQLMNGTSMSSPNAAGCVALLLSAAKAEGIDVTPVRLKRALQHTARTMPGLSHLQQGFGMIDVEAAWEYIKAHKDDIYEDVHFKVEILNRSGGPRGVYLRHKKEMEAVQNYSVFIDPIFGTSDDVDEDTQMKRVTFEMKFSLKSTAPDFVQVPDYFMLMHNGRSFKFDVDPTKLPAGVTTASIFGYDTTKPELGPRFHIPITVAKPIEVVDDAFVSFGDLEFLPNEVKRYFVNVPSGATWMDVTIKDLRNIDVDKDTSSRLFVLHTLQLLPHNAYRDAEEQKYYQLMPNREQVASIPVHAGVIIEMAFARYWSAQGKTKVSAQVKFRGVTCIPDNLTIFSGKGGGKVRIDSSLADEYIAPKATLKKYLRPICPKKAGLITPCDERDVLTSNGKQVHQLVLEYEYDNKDAGELVPRAPALQGVLYESAFESQIMLLFDEDKRYIGVADSWPSGVKAPKGKITIRLQVRHDDVSKLEPLKNLSLMIEKNLSKEINLSVHASHASMITSGDKMGRRLLRQGTNTCVFFAEPDTPSECEIGDIIVGSMTFADGAASLPGEGKKPNGAKVTFIVGAKAKEEKNEKATTPEAIDKRSDDEKLEEAIRSTKLDHLKKFADKKEDAEKFTAFYEKLTSEYKDHLPLLMEGLKFYDKKDTRKDHLDKVISAANAVIESVDEVKVAAHFGTKHDDEDAESCKEHKEQEEVKEQLIEALARKARALADIKTTTNEDFEKALKQLEKWTDDISSSSKYAVLTLERHERAGRYGLMLKVLSGLLDKMDDLKGSFAPLTKAEVLDQRKGVLEKLSFMHLKERDEMFQATAPKDFAPF